MFTQFLENKGLSNSTIEAYNYQVSRFKKIISINQYNTELIRRYLFYCNKKYSPGSFRIIMGALENYCEYKSLNFDQTIKKDIKIKESSIFMDVLSKNEVRKIVNQNIERTSIKRKRNSLLLKLLYYSGIRITELIQLKKDSLKKDYISIIGKGNKRRNIPIPLKIMKELRKAESKIYLFENTKNQPMTARSINKIIKRRVEHAKINKNVSAHTFRRSFCTNMIKSGANIKIDSIINDFYDEKTDPRTFDPKKFDEFKLIRNNVAKDRNKTMNKLIELINN